MSTISDKIVWGETYDISVTTKDSDGFRVTLDETWSVACRITSSEIGGPVVLEPTMQIVDGDARASIDTGDPEFTPGVYYYDIRFTDSDGNDYWTKPVQLILENRNTPASI